MKKILTAVLALTLILSLACSSAFAVGLYAIASPTYVRTGPGLGYKIVDKLITGEYYNWGGNRSYDSRGIAWYDVYYSGGYGWVSSLHADLVQNGYMSDFPNSNAGGTRITPNGNHEVNVRASASANSAKIGTLYPGQYCNFTGYTKNGFYQIEFHGQTGWVSTSWTHKN